jgi:hypothetical protein
MVSNDNNYMPLEVLKWIGLVFAAGFIGYFGRFIAISLIERIRKKPDSVQTMLHTQTEDSNAAENNSEQEYLKLNKKQAKLEKKRAKKASNSTYKL